MHDRPGFRWFGFLFLVLVTVGVGFAAYQAGLSHAVVTTTAPAAGTVVVAPYYWHWHPFGFVFPLFFLFLIFGVARRAMWGGGWRRGCYQGAGGVPPRFEEWHNQMHERMKNNPPSAS